MKAQLRIRTPSRIFNLSVPTNSTVNQLLKLIQKNTAIPYYQIVVKTGFPPKIVDLDPSSQQSLPEVGISFKNQLIIEHDKTRPKPIPKKEPEELKTQTPSPTLGNEQMPDHHGNIMIRRIIDADNSCLFNAVAYGMERSLNMAEEYRGIVSTIISSDPLIYNESLLGKSNKQYAQWILKKQSWGGGIELKILSDYFETEMVAISIQSLRLDNFGEGKGYSNRIFLLYDGIHYDILARNKNEKASKEGDVTIFSVDDLIAWNGAFFVANELKQKHQFTDVSNFSIQCGICFECFVGEAEAVQHATITGHQNFQEVKKS